MSRAKTLAQLLGSDGALTVADVSGAVNKAGDSHTGVHRFNSYFSVGKGASNNDQITWNAIPDNNGNYTPHWAGSGDAGGVILGLPYGGGGGLELRILRHGTNGSAKTASAYPVRWAADDSGRITMPYQPAFHVTGLTQQINAATGSGEITVWNNVNLNIGSNWNNSTGRFTAPVGGIYLFQFDPMYQHQGGDITFQIWKNGTSVAYNNPHTRDGGGYAPPWHNAPISWLGRLEANEYISFAWYSQGVQETFVYAGGLYTRAMGYLLG